MGGGEVRFNLCDGETVTIPSMDVDCVCDNLWRLAPKPGAVMLAGVLVAQSRGGLGLVPFELTEPQSAVIREALAMLEA